MKHSDLFSLWWKGFLPESIDSLSGNELLIRLKPDHAIAPRCGKCRHEFNVGDAMSLDDAARALFQCSMAIQGQSNQGESGVGGVEFCGGLSELEAAHFFHLQGEFLITPILTVIAFIISMLLTFQRL